MTPIRTLQVKALNTCMTRWKLSRMVCEPGHWQRWWKRSYVCWTMKISAMLLHFLPSNQATKRFVLMREKRLVSSASLFIFLNIKPTTHSTDKWTQINQTHFRSNIWWIYSSLQALILTFYSTLSIFHALFDSTWSKLCLTHMRSHRNRLQQSNHGRCLTLSF